MGLISGSSTVTVQAKLTDAGKKKLYDSIEMGNSGFITKFAIGDSDANYASIDAGGSVLASGHVPEVSGFRPSIRSFALYKGQYRPGVPIILVDGQYGSDNGISRSLSIGGINSAPDQRISILFDVTTEWPKDEQFVETYKIEIQNPGNLTSERLNRYFTAFYHQLAKQFAFSLNGPLNITDLHLLSGLYGSANGTVIPVKLTGKITNAQVTYNIMLTQ